ncbi:MAG: mycofactocin biosynthesis peptidyl-dipeptidase MftE [Pseudonocardiaceae bacterium]|nr:mycofactocin biosynthesis peptidyl-dipeptidase MftE [Pseudonocardiaceae bacterium]
MTSLAGRPWPELDGDPVLLVPTGSCEQHGPHLPLDTDTRIAAAVAEAAGDLVAPTIPYGSSGEHQDFPGTVSIGHDTLCALLVEYGRSACRWARRVLFVNGHGGNVAALSEAVRRLRYEGRDVAWFACTSPGGDAHAGHTETALMLAIAPETVWEERIAPGNTAPLGELMPRLRAGQLRTASPTGVLGDPTAATAAEGAELLGALIAALRTAMTQWSPNEHGRLP